MRQPSGCRAEAQNWLSGGGMAKRPAPFSLRLTFEQRARLEAEAGKMSLAAYIHSRLFGEDDLGLAERRRRPRKPVADEKALAQLMGMLGQSRLSSNLNQLAKAANTGSLSVTPDTEAALNEAATAVHEIRRLLIEALNLEIEP
ncbi:plasmid mobilization relaxosome protein MobC [Sphingobium amiense]|uniref:Plasmid mobilization relaxosome protein MobC n=1 Tax=Sphingobium amiense TaxID=135719 RepID=A0A494W8H0_9SPHN|nr:hypothetical protein [Sphingobium amiense]BBD98867.1 plasmid mobilization relaxosome protein MobC [Sphingobium amiense]